MTDFSRGVTVYGDPASPPILFLHGVRLAGSIWEEHARGLCDRYYVITPDLPGHGRLADLPFDLSVTDAFLEYLATNVLRRPPLIVGYSLGGYLAMRYATAAPQHSAGLLLTGCSTDIVNNRALFYEIAVGFTALFTERFVQRMLSAFLRLTLPRVAAEAVIPYAFNQRVFQSSRQIALNVSYSDLLANYAKPILIVNGEYDLLFRPDEAKYAAVPGAQLIVMRGADHVAPIRRPQEFTAIVRTFAERVFAD